MIAIIMHAQEYVNALRNGYYFKALELASFVTQKYEQIKTPIGAEELIPLGTYELSQTDLNENDIDAINFLYNYIQYHSSLASGVKGYALMTLLSLVTLVLAIREDEAFKATIDTITIENPTQLKDFLKDTSDFSNLIERNIGSSQKWLKAMIKPSDEGSLLEKIKEMDSQIFSNFQSDIDQLKKQLEMGKINFSCPLVQSRQQAQTLKETISEFKTHLQDKLENEGIIISSDEELVLLIDEPTLKQQKLVNRYKAISILDKQIQDKTVLRNEDKEIVGMIIEICHYNEPSWYERQLTQKFTDVLTVGLKPLYRSFFSKETRYRDKIDGVVQEAPLQKL